MNSSPTNSVPVPRTARSSALGVLALGLLAAAVDAPLLAPPLGVSVYTVARDPSAGTNAPRNIALGHAIGSAAGLGALFLCGALDLPSALAGPFTLRHAIASALAVGATAWLTERCRAEHPPALATTVVGSLGVLRSPTAVGALLLGAVAVALAAQRAANDGREERREV